MKKIFTFLLFLNFFGIAFLRAQIIITEPTVSVVPLPLILTFHAEQGTAGLKDYNGTVYCRTSIITSKSVNNTDRKYVKNALGENLPELQLIKTDENTRVWNNGSYYDGGALNVEVSGSGSTKYKIFDVRGRAVLSLGVGSGKGDRC
ncbi:MAG: hypothetical protein LBG17_06575 [Bacteroidales bacterium]|nr:hypothetical protein [Bacteroidales bacterium]